MRSDILYRGFLVTAVVALVATVGTWASASQGGPIDGRMTVLDEFASAALEGILSRSKPPTPAEAAASAYEYAEAMLTEKHKHEQQ